MKSVIKCMRLSLLAVMMVCTAAVHASNDPLCFTARNGSVTVSFEIKYVTPSTIQYSTDSTTWNTCSATTTVTLSANEKVYFRAATDQTSASAVAFGDNYYYSSSYSSSSHFTFSGAGTVDASGNIMSLYGPSCPDIALPSYAFAFMFYGCSALTTAPALPATTLADYCYKHMFSGCSALTSTPTLPATTLAYGCYFGMFYGCSALTSAPALPATTLADYCYKYMFYGCTALTSAPALPATTLAYGCYEGMFFGCTSLTSAPALPATTLADYCYEDMFAGCSSLTSAPALPATNLAYMCYRGMFYGCTALTSAPALPATSLANECYHAMFSGCTALTSAPALPATNLAYMCYSSMFSGCTSLTSAPALPATTLAFMCYSGMFSVCTSLTSAPELPATTLANYCYQGMFDRCTALTSAPALPATTLADYCYYRMFEYCSALKVNIAPPGKKWSINATSIRPDALTNMFYGTGGTMNDTPSANTTYYIYIKDSICYDTICLGDSFTNYGFNINASDIHSGDNTFTRTKTATSDDDPDTLITLYLNVPETHHEIYETICNGAVYNFAGLNITASGNYQDIASTPYGCLDTTILHLTVNERYDNYENATICQGETYNWGGNTYNTAGDYTDSLRSKDGCDSVVHLHLTVNERYDNYENATICQGETYNWGGNTYSAAGDYTDSLRSKDGCDSVVHLHLTVNERYDNYENAIICSGASYTWNGNQYSKPGDYTMTLSSEDGCDSVMHLHLIVIDNTGVDNAEMSGISVYSENNKIVVNGAEGRELRVYDAVGRLLAIKESANEMESVEVPSAGIYFVTLNNGANLRIMVR